MAQYNPIYRLTLYAGRSVDVTEATVLTPISGAAHSDNFQIATSRGVSGYQPYMGTPSGRRARLDLLSKATDVGEITVPILDFRVGALTDNLTRWMTAYLGNTTGRLRLAGLKVKIEESLDNGVTFSDYFTGRVVNLALSEKVQYILTVRDLGMDLDLPVFVGKPHTSITASTGYGQMVSLLPPTLVASYGLFPIALPLTGTVVEQRTVSQQGVSYVEAIVKLDATSRGRSDNFLTAPVAEAGQGSQFFVRLPTLAPDGLLLTMASPVYTDQVLAHIKRLDTSAEGDFLVGRIGYTEDTLQSALKGRTYKALMIVVRVLPRNSSTEGDPAGYLAMPPNNTSIQVHLIGNGPLSGANMLVLDGVHPMDLWKDLLDGDFGYLYQRGDAKPSTAAIGAQRRALPYSSQAFADLSSDATFPDARFVITEKAKLLSWVQENIEQPWQLGHYLDGSGQVVPLDLRRPSSLPSLTLTDTDLVESAQNLAWEYGSEIVSRVIGHYYEDYLFPASATRVTGSPSLAQLLKGSVGLDLPTAEGIIQSVQHTIEVRDLAHFDLGERDLTIDARGFRAMPGELGETRDRLSYLRDKLAEFALSLQQPYRGGAATIALQCRRTTNTDSVQPGTNVILDIDPLPDPRTNLRGGARVARCVERSPNGLAVTLRFVDLGANVAANPPTVGSPSLQTGSTQHGVDVVVTPNANGDAVEFHFAITSTATTAAPSESAAAWAFGSLARAIVGGTTADRTVTVEGLPGVGRFWGRGRSLPSGGDRMEQPSSWVGSTSVDMPGYTGPSALAAATSMLSDRRAVLTWTNGSTAMATDVRLTTPSTASLELLDTVVPGQSRYELLGLIAATCYLAGVRHTDLLGGYSTEATLIFTSGSTALTAPAFGGLGVTLGASA